MTVAFNFTDLNKGWLCGKNNNSNKNNNDDNNNNNNKPVRARNGKRVRLETTRIQHDEIMRV